MHFEQQLLEGCCMHPFSQLGWISSANKAFVSVWFPQASALSIRDAKSHEKIADLKKSNAGLFTVNLKSEKSKYRLYEVVAHTQDGEYIYTDPYQFSETAYSAVHFIDRAPQNLYEQAGAQLVTSDNGVKGVRFAVFAPNASAISLIGDFNHWDKQLHPMQKTDMGYWVLFIPNLTPGALYKFAIKDAHGHQLPDKSDPIGFSQHQYPSHSSVVYDHKAYKWNDAKWHQTKKDPYKSPMSIYEVHLGSWKRPSDLHKTYLSYVELAHDLIAYVKEMAYTHIEVLPVSEFPFDGSWGYQPVGLFAPTSRFGSPDDFKFFVDTCHQQNIGVIVDWVPAHFPEDGHGLAQFDGTHVYEYADPRKGWHPDWNSCIYDFGKDTVRQLLVANALFWFDKYKVDGIRVDAVASMLYLDYSRNQGEWLPNVDGGNHNYEAISLLQWINTAVYAQFPQAITIAEESTSFAGVSKPVSAGGLGFGFKWNMGWMHDSLHYIAKDSAYRAYHHCELTFSMVYAYDENFVLPISHDEVVHGKGSMIQKMPGDEWQKFANLRAYYGFMFGHPGKKLQFMGNEIAQIAEWDHDLSLDWDCLQTQGGDGNFHTGISNLYRALNKVYVKEPCLHALDHEHSGFRWIDINNAQHSILSFARFSGLQNDVVLVVNNFTPSVYEHFKIGVPFAGKYKLILNTDDADFGGSGYKVKQTVSSKAIAANDFDNSVDIIVPPLATMFFKILAR
ncbi:1,4-alpha-glucan branching enzyme [Glaciecola punicea ACAM 611]|jgi:1,4-alpha-glucan branching enzyme|uniref:1,4-alpha-glucan branching enzyme GlgB n=1 Tax=Glaciecola punicea ACAM 611 TaxID=1121923 RepID=H5T914_9ALTE|nr:1,4-alpha-glucan branching protein GlgB [Glaciecola punicea]OFA31677.1 1,4-alpha-glucan branching enzyme [Glaciecola punicea]GAB54791.1 1,4-alpha-glucan branching enzyme [Glaciecola punicea ACAM 611]